jgi:hypothetical protein
MASQYDSLITEAAAKHGLDAKLFRRQLYQESKFDPNAVSPKGAIGLAQFMPGTAAQYGVDPKDPAQSIMGAARYMFDLKKQFNGDQNLALAAYNWGPGNVTKMLQGQGVMPEETRQYLARINGLAMPDENGGQLPGPRAQAQPPAQPGQPAQPRPDLSTVLSQIPPLPDQAPPANLTQPNPLAFGLGQGDPATMAWQKIGKAFQNIGY